VGEGVGEMSANQRAAIYDSLSMNKLPELQAYFSSPEHQALVAGRRAVRAAEAEAARERREADRAERQAAKDRTAQQARERKRSLKFKAVRVARIKKQLKRGRPAALAVARWAFYRKFSTKTVAWEEKRNWMRRMLNQASRQILRQHAGELGTDELAKQFKADYPQVFWEEVAKYIFICYWKTGDRPPIAEIRTLCGFDLN